MSSTNTWNESAYPPEALRFYFGDRARADDRKQLKAFIEGLQERPWAIEAPYVVDDGRAAELRTYTFRAERRHDDPDQERRTLGDAHWLVERLADWTRASGREVELAFDEETIGWVVRGTVERELAEFLGRWKRTLDLAEREEQRRSSAVASKQCRVTVWLGDLTSQAELDEYLAPHPDGDRRRSWFARELGIQENLDDELEAYWESPKAIPSLLAPLSFGASFVPAVVAAATKLGMSVASTVIAVFDGKLGAESVPALARGRLRPMGTFTYDPDAPVADPLAAQRRLRKRPRPRVDAPARRSRFGEVVERDPILAMSVVRSLVSADDDEQDGLPKAARHVFHVLWADSEIRNGGISQLIYNRGIEQAVRSAEGMRQIGALQAAFILESAVDRVGEADPRSIDLNDLDAAYYDHEPPVRALLADYLEQCTDPWFDRVAVDREVRRRTDDATPQRTLQAAIELGAPTRVSRALAAGASATTPNEDGATPLDQAIAQLDTPSRVKVLETLLDAGAPHLGVRNSNGRSPLSHAASWGRAAFVRVLLERGAPVDDAGADGATALHHASGADVTELLLDAGADTRALTSDGRNALHRVSDIDHLRVLLDAGVEPGHVAKNGHSVLHQSLDVEAVTLLLDAGLDANLADAEGRTPLMCQAWPASMAVLIERGARIDAVDKQGRTVLHHHNSDDCTELLLARGANPLAEDFDGNTPLDDARAHDYFGGRYVRMLETAANGPAPAPKAEPPLPEPSTPPMVRMAVALIERLVTNRVIELEDETDTNALADQLADVLGGLVNKRDPGGELGRWLLDRDEVVEIFATDEELLAILRQGLP